MTARTAPPFRADHVGSFLRPQFLLVAREQHAAGANNAEQLRTVEDQATTDIVKFQEDVGLQKSITDGGFRPLRFLPKGKILVLGLVTTKISAMESTDDLCRRIDEAAQYAPLDQLCLSPQGGFSSTVHGNNIAVAAQRDKLKLVVDVARKVWGDTAG